MKTSKLKSFIPEQLPFPKFDDSSLLKLSEKAQLKLERIGKLEERIDDRIVKKLIQDEMRYSKNVSLLAIESAIGAKKVSVRLACKLHKALASTLDVPPEDLGKIRNRQNWIGPEKQGIEKAYFLPPDPKELRKGLKNWQQYVTSEDKDPLIQIAIAFAQFLILHPFMDGNGKVARLLVGVFLRQKKILKRSVLFMSEYFKKHRLEYFLRLYLVSKRKSWKLWIQFFLRGIIFEADSLLNKIK